MCRRGPPVFVLPSRLLLFPLRCTRFAFTSDRSATTRRLGNCARTQHRKLLRFYVFQQGRRRRRRRRTILGLVLGYNLTFTFVFLCYVNDALVHNRGSHDFQPRILLSTARGCLDSDGVSLVKERQLLKNVLITAKMIYNTYILFCFETNNICIITLYVLVVLGQ